MNATAYPVRINFLNPPPILRAAARVLEFADRWFPRSSPNVHHDRGENPEPVDINELQYVPDHLALVCELHDEHRLLTSIPIIASEEAELNEEMFESKARNFPNSWNAVLGYGSLPESSLVGEPPRLLARSCPMCRAAALRFADERRRAGR